MITQELQDSRELAAELQVQAQCHLEDKLQLKSVLSETQKHLVLNEKKMSELERVLSEEKRIKMEKVRAKLFEAKFIILLYIYIYRCNL